MIVVLWLVGAHEERQYEKARSDPQEEEGGQWTLHAMADAPTITESSKFSDSVRPGNVHVLLDSYPTIFSSASTIRLNVQDVPADTSGITTTSALPSPLPALAGRRHL